MSTLETLQEILSCEFDLKPAELSPEAKLAQLGVDSLEVLELMFEIEDRFALKIKDDIPTNLVTIDDVVQYIDSLLAQQSPAHAAAGPGLAPFK
ncbi:MAG TPA: acyl carrier protein [Steroidobacteraceae bacterium]